MSVGGNEKMEKRKDVKREFECHIFEDDGLIEYECGRVSIDGSWEVISSMKAAGSSYSKGVNSSSFLFGCRFFFGSL